MARPRILITLDLGEAPRRQVPFDAVILKTAYPRAVEAAGGVPVLASPTDDPEVIEALLQLTDGLIVTGGAFDIPPQAYGKAQTATRVDAAKPLRTRFETALIRRALFAELPVLGICGGMQLLNVVLGGDLVQDIGEQIDGALEHEQPSSPRDPFHDIEIIRGTTLHEIAGTDRASVNTTHHQAVDHLGKGLVIEATSEDGVIEAIGLRDSPLAIGVQWHPELLEDALSQAIYAHLVEQARRFSTLRS